MVGSLPCPKVFVSVQVTDIYEQSSLLRYEKISAVKSFIIQPRSVDNELKTFFSKL